MPVNPWPVVGAAPGRARPRWAPGCSLQHVHRVEVDRKALAAARAADPDAALPGGAGGPAGGHGDRALDASWPPRARSSAYRTWIPGWSLASAECSATAQACTRDWVRRGGSFDDLRRALPDDGLEMLVPQGSTVPALDVARTTHPFKIARRTMLDPGHPLRSLQAAFSDAGPQLQRWRTADVVIELKKPALWPRVRGRARRRSSIRPPCWPGDVDMHNVPGPFIVEALESAPDFVSWESVRVDLGEGSDARGLLKFSATGVFYVAAR